MPHSVTPPNPPPLEIQKAYIDSIRADLVKRQVTIKLVVGLSPEVLELRPRLAELSELEIPADVVFHPAQKKLGLAEMS